MTRMSGTTLAVLIIGGLSFTLSSRPDGNGFLKASPRKEELVSQEDVQTSLLAEVEGTLGEGSASSRVKQFETALGPIYASLPRNEKGFIGHATVHYALHRIFVKRHGWIIKGLDSAGSHRNSTSGAGLLKEQVPAYVQELFEKRLGGRGFGLHELAVVAATIEHLVHNEAMKRVGDTLVVHDLLPTSQLNESMADEILETYMTAYVNGDDIPDGDMEYAKLVKQDMNEIYPSWNETKDFVRSMRRTITESDASAEQKASGTLDFALLARVAERVSEHFGTFQNRDCKKLKGDLVQVQEKGNTGRVRLSDFYKPGFDGQWQFQETVPYLRQIGAMDESDSDRPRVIIANYIYSHANCIGSSGFYSICCIDECEGLLGHLEEHIAAPEATPTRIAEIVAKLASSSVAAPRQLQPALRDRLGEIAAAHGGGSVPLHGRLFAQWMHHAYPLECPYPHVSGTTNPETPGEWSKRTGDDTYSSEEDMLAHVEKASNMTESEEEFPTLPWDTEEELLITQAQEQMTGGNGLLTNIRNVGLFMAVVSIAYGLVHNSGRSPAAKQHFDDEKFLV